MTKSREKVSNNIVTMEIKRREAKFGKKITHPAGKDDSYEIDYTKFEVNQERTELMTGEGKEFDNDIVLEMLGFEKDSNGVLVLKAEPSKDNVVSLEEEQKEENELGA